MIPRLILRLSKSAAAKFYKGCSDSVKPYFLCHEVDASADAIVG